MTKSDFVAKIQGSVSEMTKKEAADVVDQVFETLAEAIKEDGRFSFAGFGTFVVRNRAARIGRNPRTKKEITIKASKTVSFKAAPVLKERL